MESFLYEFRFFVVELYIKIQMKIYMKIIWNIQARIEIYQYTDSFDTRTDTPIISCPIREQQSPPPPITFRKTVPFIERRFLSRAASRSASKENIPIRANFNSGNHFTKAHPSLAHTDAHKIGVFASLFSSSLSNVPLSPPRCPE